MGAGFWTDERTARLVQLRAEGWSYSGIARDLGSTKSACIGMGAKLGLGKRKVEPCYVPDADNPAHKSAELGSRALLDAIMRYHLKHSAGTIPGVAAVLHFAQREAA